MNFFELPIPIIKITNITINFGFLSYINFNVDFQFLAL